MAKAKFQRSKPHEQARSVTSTMEDHADCRYHTFLPRRDTLRRDMTKSTCPEEKERGITINTSTLSIDRSVTTLTWINRHADYVKNMITGAAQMTAPYCRIGAMDPCRRRVNIFAARQLVCRRSWYSSISDMVTIPNPISWKWKL